VVLRGYLGAVNLEIFNDPGDISWKILDDTTRESIFGFPAGWYEEGGLYVQFVNLQTGMWEFQLSRESLTADAVAQIGIVNTTTGAFEVIDTMDFAASSTDGVLTTIFSLD
jgi:hypothetical protein